MWLNRSVLPLVFVCVTAHASGGMESNTNIDIAVSMINPFITSSMSSIQAKVETILSYYKENNRKAIEKRNIYFQRFRAMDYEIDLKMREIRDLDQQLLELRKMRKEKQ